MRFEAGPKCLYLSRYSAQLLGSKTRGIADALGNVTSPFHVHCVCSELCENGGFNNLRLVELVADRTFEIEFFGTEMRANAIAFGY